MLFNSETKIVRTWNDNAGITNQSSVKLAHCLGQYRRRIWTMVTHRSHVISILASLSSLEARLCLGGSPSKIQFLPSNELQLHWICQKGETKQLPIWHGSDQCALECRQYQLESVWKPGLDKRWWAQDCDDNILAALSSAASHMPSPVLRKTDLQQSRPDTETFTHKPFSDESLHQIAPVPVLIFSWIHRGSEVWTSGPDVHSRSRKRMKDKGFFILSLCNFKRNQGSRV